MQELSILVSYMLFCHSKRWKKTWATSRILLFYVTLRAGRRLHHWDRVQWWKISLCSCAAAIAVEVGLSVTLVHYSSEHWQEMRCGGSCFDCRNTSRGLQHVSVAGFIATGSSCHDFKASTVAATSAWSTETFDKDHSTCCTAQSERSQRTPETTKDHVEDTSPSTIHGRPAEDDRDWS